MVGRYAILLLVCQYATLTGGRKEAGLSCHTISYQSQIIHRMWKISNCANASQASTLDVQTTRIDVVHPVTYHLQTSLRHL